MASPAGPEAHEEREFKYAMRVQSAYFQYMYDEGDTVEDAKARISKTLDMAEAAGANTIDTQVAWAGVDLGDERGSDFERRYIWDPDIEGHEDNHLDNLLREAGKRGFTVNLQIEATPDWVHPYLIDRATDCGTPSASPYCVYDYRFWHPPRGAEEIGHFGNFMADLAGYVEGEHPDLIGHYKIWNEPNNQPFWEPELTSQDSHAEYVELLRAAHIAAKGVDPEARVSFGGISLNNYGYLREFYEAAREAHPGEAEENGYFFDLLEVHPYVYPLPPYSDRSPDGYTQELSGTEFTSADSFTGEAFDYIGEVNGNFLGFQQMKAVMDAEEGNPEKTLYLGEFGYRVPSNVSDERRALYLKRAYDQARSYAYVEGMAWFTFYQSDSLEEGELDWTTVERDFSPSLTYRAYKQTTGAEASNVEVAITMPYTVDGVHSIEPSLANISADDISRFELYVDGDLIDEQATAPITWDTSDTPSGMRRVMAAARAADGSVWPSNTVYLFVSHATGGFTF